MSVECTTEREQSGEVREGGDVETSGIGEVFIEVSVCEEEDK
jgi:hypothetical protein